MKTVSPSVKAVLKIGRFEIPYRVYEHDGPHLICLNGIQQSMAMWQGFVGRFAEDLLSNNGDPSSNGLPPHARRKPIICQF